MVGLSYQDLFGFIITKVFIRIARLAERITACYAGMQLREGKGSGIGDRGSEIRGSRPLPLWPKVPSYEKRLNLYVLSYNNFNSSKEKFGGSS